MPVEHPEGLRVNKGFHPILAKDHPYIFVDACMQAWPDADAQVWTLIDKLAGRGYSDDDIAGMLGENLLRVFEVVWK